MLRGLDRNPAGRTATIDSYDLFVFEDIEERAAGMPLDGRMHDGDSFLALYLDRLGSGASRVTPHVGDVVEQSWPEDRRIEFLFNDVAKTWEIWNHLKSTFYSALDPGATVVEQDWAHACTPWLHLWHHRHRDHFEVLGQVPNAGSVAFRLVSPLPSTAFAADRAGRLRDPEVVAAFDWAATLVDPSRDAERQSRLRAALHAPRRPGPGQPVVRRGAGRLQDRQRTRRHRTARPRRASGCSVHRTDEPQPS